MVHKHTCRHSHTQSLGNFRNFATTNQELINTQQKLTEGAPVGQPAGVSHKPLARAASHEVREKNKEEQVETISSDGTLTASAEVDGESEAAAWTGISFWVNTLFHSKAPFNHGKSNSNICWKGFTFYPFLRE